MLGKWSDQLFGDSAFTGQVNASSKDLDFAEVVFETEPTLLFSLPVLVVLSSLMTVSQILPERL